MTACSKTLLAAGCAACLAFGSATEARAWDAAPWNPLPFDQSSQIEADPRAKIARVEAEAIARAAAARGGKTGGGAPAPAPVADGRHGCTVSVGGVGLPQGARGRTDIVTNVQVRGDVITVCR